MHILVGDRTFGPGAPMIVAEISCNHCGDYGLACELIEEAAHAGADAVKFQLYEPERMAPPGAVLTTGPWAGRELRDLYEEARTPREWLPDLYAVARGMSLIPFTSVFDPDDVGFLEALETPIYKIASAEAGWLDLKLAVAETRKPVLVSNGAVDTEVALRGLGAAVVMQCVAEYPADPHDYGFGDARNTAIQGWGLSDHSMEPNLWSVAAAKGATVIEAHLMLPGFVGHSLDSGHSMTPNHFSHAAALARAAAIVAHSEPARERDVEFQRRWLWARDLPAGHEARTDDFVAMRCPEGLAVQYGPPVGRILNTPVKQYEQVRL